MVLLKRKDGILPLPKTNARILVAGSHADNIGNQCGGWTVSWQGKSGATTAGTTILEAMKKAAPSVKIDFSLSGDFYPQRHLLLQTYRIRLLPEQESATN